MWLFSSLIVLLVYTGMNIYSGIRIFWLFRFFSLPLRAFVFWPVYIVFSFSYIFIFLLRLDRFPPLRQVGMYSLPALVYLFLAILALDLVRLVFRLFNRAPFSPAQNAADTGIAVCLTVLVMIYGAFHARDIGTVHYNVSLKKGGAMPPLRLTLISDLHIGTTVNLKWVAGIVDTVNRTEPDIICIAGDLFDSNIAALPKAEGIAEELRRLKAPLGVYACQGNHDVDRLSPWEGSGTEQIQKFLENAGISFLQDEVIIIDGRFYLAGRRDASNRRFDSTGERLKRKTADELFAGLDKSRPLIVLDHQPVDFGREEEAGADLVLSGHTHKGQFFPGNIATKRIFKKSGAVHYGYWQGRSAQAVVSSGAGVWGPPVRIATRSEVAVVHVAFGE